MSTKDIQRRVLTGRDMSGRDLRAYVTSDLPPLHFDRCDLSGANLTGAHLQDALFTDCDATGTVFTRALLDGSSWVGGKAPQADFAESDAIGSRYESVDLANTRWGNANLTDAVFEGCRLTGARFQKLNGFACTFLRCKMTLAHLQNIDLNGRHLQGNDLSDANLSGADLRNTTFERTSLQGANLRDARFEGANLSGAELGMLTPESFQDFTGASISLGQAEMLVAALGLTILFE